MIKNQGRLTSGRIATTVQKHGVARDTTEALWVRGSDSIGAVAGVFMAPSVAIETAKTENAAKTTKVKAKREKGNQ